MSGIWLFSRRTALAAAIALPFAWGSAFAAPGHGGGHHHGGTGEAIGEPADPSAATRTVRVELGDNFFRPESIRVQPGETVRFVLVNTGQLLHEFNIGTPRMHEVHQKEMLEMMELGVLTGTELKTDHGSAHSGHGMTHDDPNSVLLEPGEKKELTWRFAGTTDLEFACNVPGHYEAGMVGDIRQGG